MGSPDSPQLGVSETGFFLPTKQLPFSIMVKHQWNGCWACSNHTNHSTMTVESKPMLTSSHSFRTLTPLFLFGF